MSKLSDIASRLSDLLTLFLPPFLIAACIFMLGGGVYEVAQAVWPRPWREQSPTDALTFMILLGLSLSGLYLTFKSVKYLHTPREAYMLAFVGLALAALGYLGIQMLVR
jgi:formate hydrogenlyase subunit 3/multisubunit Na+/H+ antiporter MnhD subunit